MIQLRHLAALTSLLIIAGCGGSSSNPNLNAVKLSLTPGQYTGYAYSVNSVGQICGAESNGTRDVGAVWLTPSRSITLPLLDSRTQEESSTAVSPGRIWVGGISNDAGSGPPEREFVYNLNTNQFHVLKLPENNINQYDIRNVDDQGNVTGVIFLQGQYQLFSYNLQSDSYQTSNAPDFSNSVQAPAGYSDPQINAYSDNYLYAAGDVSNRVGTFAVIWNTTTGQGIILDPVHSGTAFSVTNDGTTALYRLNLPSAPAYLWTAKSGIRSLLDLAHSFNLGSNWVTTDWECLSANGKFVTFTGKVAPNYQFSFPVRVTLN